MPLKKITSLEKNSLKNEIKDLKNKRMNLNQLLTTEKN